MIFIVYPPGTYGSYVLQSLYKYSELGKNESFKFNTDTGSSHNFRESSVWQEHFATMHLDEGIELELKSDDKCVCILPNFNHNLDYFNNQFIKQDKGYLIKYILNYFTETNFRYKLQTFWNFNSDNLNTIPKWILREWFSFWIEDCWKNSYNVSKYKKLNSNISFDTSALFNNHVNILTQTIEKVGLKRVTDLNQIQKNGNKFMKLQKYHNSQINCDRWIYDLLNGKLDSVNPCNTIFDEAYIQKKMRDENIELLCDNLNEFPLKSGDMLQYLKS